VAKKTMRQQEIDFDTQMDADSLKRAAEIFEDKGRLSKAKKVLSDQAKKAQSAVDNIDGLRSK